MVSKCSLALEMKGDLMKGMKSSRDLLKISLILFGECIFTQIISVGITEDVNSSLELYCSIDREEYGILAG
jgi:hypothetical protein